ncbi:MAG: hypothetical protein BWY09_02746 [Candidatus Hydrogenedentes bacterium ADurb.Bin179]|nr:MAG: hypothetical protein BWY09_02746 [Candidatus Hydrogenedentes bacterium ADurb.Bin179]
MKTKIKTFDCVEMMHRSASRIYEETKDMSVQEELAYWRQHHAQDLEKLNEERSNTCRPK